MTTIYAEKIKDYHYYKLKYEMHSIKDKFKFFEYKYSSDFEVFEANVLNSTV